MLRLKVTVICYTEYWHTISLSYNLSIKTVYRITVYIFFIIILCIFKLKLIISVEKQKKYPQLYMFSVCYFSMKSIPTFNWISTPFLIYLCNLCPAIFFNSINIVNAVFVPSQENGARYLCCVFFLFAFWTNTSFWHFVVFIY